MRVAVVVHPLTADQAALHALVADRCAELGHALVGWSPTTPDDAGTGPAAAAVRDGADVVLVAGGDGTVRAAVDALAGTGTALAVLPTGTGNLLARNLGLPLDLPAAVEVGLTGQPRRLDVGLATRDGEAGSAQRFVVMAGIGLDAAMVADASPSLKARWGWPAYVLSAAQHLRDDALGCTVTVDGAVLRRHGVRTVLVANVGALQAGLRLLPDARPDDGLLDVAVVAPRGLLDWARLARRVLAAGRTSDRRLERLAGRQVEVRTARPRRCQLDGDPFGRTGRLVVQVEPLALTVLVPR